MSDYSSIFQLVSDLMRKEKGSCILIGGFAVNFYNEFVVPSLNHLIALKLHSMKFNFKDRLAKDFPDIIGLIRTNKLNIHDNDFRELCLKYGSEDIYQRIMEVLR